MTNGKIVLGIKMDLKEAQEILKEHNFTLNEWRYTDAGNRVYEQFPIGYLKDNKQVYLVLSVWGSLKKDKFVKDSVSLDACTKSSYSSYYLINKQKNQYDSFSFWTKNGKRGKQLVLSSYFSCLSQPWRSEPDGHCSCRKPCKLCGA